MKLTTSDRDAFVRAVMNDVPAVDYDEKAREVVTAATVAKLPPKVREIWNDPKLRGFLRCNQWQRLPRPLHDLNTLPVDGWETEAVKEKLQDLATAKHKQEEEHDALQAKLRGIIKACSTLKQATERLPEFVKYLPADRTSTGVVNLPVANVVADLMAAGWPKDQPKPKKKGASK